MGRHGAHLRARGSDASSPIRQISSVNTKHFKTSIIRICWVHWKKRVATSWKRCAMFCAARFYRLPKVMHMKRYICLLRAEGDVSPDVIVQPVSHSHLVPAQWKLTPWEVQSCSGTTHWICLQHYRRRYPASTRFWLIKSWFLSPLTFARNSPRWIGLAIVRDLSAN